ALCAEGAAAGAPGRRGEPPAPRRVACARRTAGTERTRGRSGTSYPVGSPTRTENSEVDVDVASADAGSIADLWDRLTGTQPDPPWWLVILVGLLALGAVVHGPTWRVARNVVTIAHEGGHALIALATGRKL